MFTEPRVGCGVAVIVDGRILLLKRRNEPEPGCWGIAGGKVDLFESAAEAGRRELEEETGIRAGGLEWLCFVDQIDRDAGSHWVSPIYLARGFEGRPRLVEPDKHEAMDWFDLDALPGPLAVAVKATLPALKRALG